MRWYSPIECDNTVDDPYVAGKGDLAGCDEWQLRVGKSALNWNTSAWIKPESKEDDGQPDDVLQSYLGLPIYSERLRSALQRGGIKGIQYLPIHVFRSDGSEISGFTIANITERIPALDFEHSRFTLFPADYFLQDRRGQVSSLLAPVLDTSAVGPRHIFRLDEFNVAYFASEVFKQIFEEGGFTGYSFKEVEARGKAAVAR